ncbi:MAG: SOS response-associated peptidase [Kiritimatiellales bacterium]|nr:SOS response-associated peptidase [Kiritimatiellales bacterium]
MCGRFTQTKSREEVLEALADIELPPLFGQRYNIAPTQRVTILRTEAPQRAEAAIWGFRNPQSSAPVINARLETLPERPMFRHLIQNNRCLILADGFYEWKERTPYYFQLPDRSLFAFAGLWQKDACVIITRAADKNMRDIHHRMPLIIPSNHWKTWLTPPHERQSKLTIDNLDCTLRPPPLAAHPVSCRVNKVVNDDVLCIKQVGEQTDLSLFPDTE